MIKNRLLRLLSLVQHAGQDTGTAGEVKAATRPSWAVRLKRVLAAFLFSAAIYFALGSWFYGGWWYGFLWGGQAFEKHYVINGIFFLLDHEASSVILVLLIVACLAAYLTIRRNWLLPLLDRIWGWIVVGSAFSILITSVLIYKNHKTEYALYDAATNLLANLGQLVEVLGEDYYPTVTPPVSFEYLDKVTLDSLYSQIIPELIEKQRSIETSDKRQLKAGVSGHGISGELGSEKDSQIKSNLERVEFSQERKCVELINYSLKEGRAHYYVNAEAWFAHKALKELSDKFEQIRKDPANINPNRFDTDFSDQAVEKRKRETRQKYSSSFIREMTALSGLILLKGEFVVSKKNGKEVTLRHSFSEGDPLRIDFVVTVSAVLPYARGERVRQLSVFARVDHPLDDRGEIRAQAITIF